MVPGLRCVVLGALCLALGCLGRDNRPTIDDLLGLAGDDIETYYWAHGHMPSSDRDLSVQWHSLARKCAGFDGWSLTWTFVEPRGCDPFFPYAADLHLVVRSDSTGKLITQADVHVELAAKGKMWTTRYRWEGPHKPVPIDDPFNIACSLALSSVDSHRLTGRWDRVEDLIARNDRELEKNLVITRTVRSFHSRSVERQGTVRLVLSCGMDGNDYIFDPDRVDSKEPPIVRPTPKRVLAR